MDNNNYRHSRPFATGSPSPRQGSSEVPNGATPIKFFRSTEIIPLPYQPLVTPQTKFNQMQLDKQKKVVPIMIQQRPHHSMSSPIKHGPQDIRSSSTSKLDAAINHLKNSSSNGLSRQSTSTHSNVDNSPVASANNNTVNAVVVSLPASQSVTNLMCKPSPDIYSRNKQPIIRTSATPQREIKASSSHMTPVRMAPTKWVQTKEVQLKPVSVAELTHASTSFIPRSSPVFNKQRSFIKITPKRKYAAELNMQTTSVKQEESVAGGGDQSISKGISLLVSNASNGLMKKDEPLTLKQDDSTEPNGLSSSNSDDGIPKTKELLDAADRASPNLRLYHRSPTGTFTKVITCSQNDSAKKNKATIVNIPFIWDDYLKATSTSAAPSNCFRQTQGDLVCKFEMGMKLETRDPRNLSAWCLATVIRREGIRIQLRLDGSGNSNDFWQLIDSAHNRPVGSTKGGQDSLAPPVGFTSCCSSYPKWIEKRIAKPGTVLAPDNCFEPEPERPPVNLFKRGMKLEAVDKKNTYLICPATVGDVQGAEISVVFDGWKGSFDYKCSYDSRDIFPVGWCNRTGYTLQRPGNWPAILHMAQKPVESIPDIPISTSQEETLVHHESKKKRISFQEPIEEFAPDTSCRRTTPVDKWNLTDKQQSSEKNVLDATNVVTHTQFAEFTSSVPSLSSSKESSSNALRDSIDDTDTDVAVDATQNGASKKRKRGRPKSFHGTNPASKIKLLSSDDLHKEYSVPPAHANEFSSKDTDGNPSTTNGKFSINTEQNQLSLTKVPCDSEGINTSGIPTSNIDSKSKEMLSVYKMGVEDVINHILKKDDILARHINVFLENVSLINQKSLRSFFLSLHLIPSTYLHYFLNISLLRKSMVNHSCCLTKNACQKI